MATDDEKPHVYVPPGETPPADLQIEDLVVGDGDEAAAGQDVELTFRLPSGLILPGTVDYEGAAPTLQGDFDNDSDVDGADFLTWQLRNSNTPGAADLSFQWGVGRGFAGAIAGDWNGDGVDTIGFRR